MGARGAGRNLLVCYHISDCADARCPRYLDVPARTSRKQSVRHAILSFDPATVDPQIGREIVVLRDELEREAGGGAALRAALPAPVVLVLSWMLTISEHGADLTRVMAAGMNVKVAKDVLPAAV